MAVLIHLDLTAVTLARLPISSDCALVQDHSAYVLGQVSLSTGFQTFTTMKKRFTLLPLSVVLFSTSALAHTVAYPHGHPHGAGANWADVLIMGGLLAVVTFGTSALLRWRAQSRPARQKIRQD
jgi:hypothetical protein